MQIISLVLASSSPRRKELLSNLGLNFEVVPANIDETVQAGETAAKLVKRLAKQKAKSVAALHPQALVIAADTVVVLKGQILNKPIDEQENRQFIEELSGQTHQVFTGHCLVYLGQLCSKITRTNVTFRQLNTREIDHFIASGEGLDKAGGYAIQGLGAALVSRIEGCYTNVVGLSLGTVIESATELGVNLV